MALQQEVEHQYFGGKVVNGNIESPDAYPADEVEVPYDPPMTASSRVLFGNEPFIGYSPWSLVPRLLQYAITKIHVNNSHALLGEDLVQHLRVGGASLRALAAARVFECQRCKENARPEPSPVARVPRYSRFGQCVGLDFCKLP